jgi:hypothetical protein
MNDPKRLREPGADRFTSLLLESGRSDAPPKARLDRMLSGVVAAGLTAGAKASVASAAALAAPLAAKAAVPTALVLKWLGVGALAGIAMSAVALRLESLSRTDPARVLAPPSEHAVVAPLRRPSEGQPHDLPAVTPPASRVQPTEIVAPTGVDGRARPPSRDSSPSAAHSKGGAVVVTEPSPPSTPSARSFDPAALDTAALREEVAALGLAKAALNRGAPAVALDAVRAYRARYPAGRLRPEAAYIEMEAEHALGNRERATDLAKQLASGGTPNAERARIILKGNEP